jgi:formyl-CoA transferase
MKTWTLSKTKHEVMKELADLGLPVGAVQDTVEVFNDPHLEAREMIVDTHDPARGDYKLIGCPIKIESNHVQLKVPPRLGEHSDEVLGSLLGMKDSELAELREAGVI